MFVIDATFEDLRIRAESPTGQTYQVDISDSLTGESKLIELEADKLQMILAFNLHNDGEPVGHEYYYQVLEPHFVGWPNNLRPIP